MKKNKSIDWKNYDPNDFFDELIAAKGKPRPAATAITDYLGNLGSEEIQARQQAAELAILEMGISFTIYSEGENIDRAWPFDIIPRVISLREWETIEQGLAHSGLLQGLFGRVGRDLAQELLPSGDGLEQ